MLQLGEAINEAGVTREFASAVGSWWGTAGWISLFAVAIVVYYYAHYGFASITAHMLAMLPAFGTLLIAKGAPAGLVFFALACAATAAGHRHTAMARLALSDRVERCT